MDNSRLARVLAEMADISEIRGDNAFKIRALRNAAETIESLPYDVAVRAAEPEQLQAIQGIGASIAKKIQELVTTGHLAEYQRMREEYPPTLLELLEVEGVGPKKVKLFHESLGVRSVDDLEAAAREGRVRDLPRLSIKTEAKLLKAIESHRARSGRFLLAEGEATAQRLRAMIESLPGVQRLEVAGSLRRRRETIGDLDILVACDNSSAIMDRFAAAGEVIAKGDTKCSIRLSTGLQTDLRVVPLTSFGAALHYFTGSKLHNVAVRTMGVRRGLTINEYGVYRINEEGQPGERLGGDEEEDIFEAIGLPWIAPELRENHGEIEAASQGTLPAILETRAIRGDVHMHTTETDGSNSIEEMALAALERGLEYIAITDHSKALAMARGLDEERLGQHARAIRAVDKKLTGKIRVFCGIEVDILKTGELDLAHGALAELDVVVGSVHSHFHLPADEMTARLVRAIESGFVDIVGHPTGRILTRRDPYAFEMETVLRAARTHGVAMEISATPDRLDLSDTHARMAKELGVKLVINTDAHATEHLDFLRHGVDNARRGWLESGDVLNTLAADAFLSALHEGHR